MNVRFSPITTRACRTAGSRRCTCGTATGSCTCRAPVRGRRQPPGVLERLGLAVADGAPSWTRRLWPAPSTTPSATRRRTDRDAALAPPDPRLLDRQAEETGCLRQRARTAPSPSERRVGRPVTASRPRRWPALRRAAHSPAPGRRTVGPRASRAQRLASRGRRLGVVGEVVAVGRARDHDAVVVVRRRRRHLRPAQVPRPHDGVGSRSERVAHPPPPVVRMRITSPASRLVVSSASTSRSPGHRQGRR